MIVLGTGLTVRAAPDAAPRPEAAAAPPGPAAPHGAPSGFTRFPMLPPRFFSSIIPPDYSPPRLLSAIIPPDYSPPPAHFINNLLILSLPLPQ